MNNITQSANKERYIALINSIHREGARKEELLLFLENSDFFCAPASTKYHGSFEGGLCAHCLSVYDNFKNLVAVKQLEDKISEDTIIILSLLHDMAKINFYKKDFRNKKVYSSDGSKYDNLGRFDWVSEEMYTVIPVEERFLFGNHEETSEFFARQYMPLTYEESSAIINHHCGMSFDSTDVAYQMVERYPAAALLHIADMLAAYIDKV